MPDNDTDNESPSPLEISQASLEVEEDPRATRPPAHLAPGDEVAPGTAGAAEGLCRACGGSGMSNTADGETPCPVCEGAGKVTVGVGGG
jgi:hypothetical protein